MSRARWSIHFDGACIEVSAIPHRPFMATKVYWDDDGRLFAINARGTLFCSTVSGANLSYRRIDRKTIGVLEGFAAMGAIPKEQVAGLRKRFDEYHRAEKLSYHAEELIDNAQAAGITLTTAQRSSANRLMRAARR